MSPASDDMLSKYKRPTAQEAKNDDGESAVHALLVMIGEDPDREGLKDTPKRFAKALREMTAGYQMDPKKVLSTVFTSDNDEMVVVRDVSFYSLCEHHVLPFTGKATIGYVPGEAPIQPPNGHGRQYKIVGLSKLPRLIQVYAKRLQVQEQLTQQIAMAIEEHLAPKGVGVLVSARHTCCAARGARSETEMVTSCLRGVFRTQHDTRAEFLALARGQA
jgi:GTP cyclohydrolase IA